MDSGNSVSQWGQSEAYMTASSLTSSCESFYKDRHRLRLRIKGKTVARAS